jgi:ribosomal protein L15
MSILEQQIAESRANKKAVVKKSVIAFILFVTLSAIAVSFSHLMPVTQFPDDVVTEDSKSLVEKTETKHNDMDRKALQSRLTRIKSTVENTLNNSDLIDWDTMRSDELKSLVDDAYFEYGGSHFSKANIVLDEIEQKHGVLVKEYEMAFKTSFTQAKSAFDNKDISLAIKLNRYSLQINSQHPPALLLQQRIDAHKEVNALYEEARIGKVENNLNKQKAALKKIIDVDPLQQEATQSLARVNKQLMDIAFSTSLTKAVNAIDAGDFSAAQSALSKAASLKNNSPQLATLQARIDSEKSILGSTSAEQQVMVFVSSDEWPTVKMLAQGALKKYPSNVNIQRVFDSANQIQSANNKLDGYINRPERLSDSNIRQRATEAISQYSSLTELSSKLATKIAKLETLVINENNPVEVTIQSDNDTYIKVIGVGNVGKTSSKIIQLKPGRYQIQGSRKGYRSKIISLVVKKSASPMVVRIECTERV